MTRRLAADQALGLPFQMVGHDAASLAAQQAYFAEIEARRCHICACRHPSFGFGPPLNPKGTIWSCGSHRKEVESLLKR